MYGDTLTVGQLYNWLGEVLRADPDKATLPVRIAYQPNYPLESDVVGMALLSQAANPDTEVQGEVGECEEDDEDDELDVYNEEQRRGALAEYAANPDALYLVGQHCATYRDAAKRVWGIGRDQAATVDSTVR